MIYHVSLDQPNIPANASHILLVGDDVGDTKLTSYALAELAGDWLVKVATSLKEAFSYIEITSRRSDFPRLCGLLIEGRMHGIISTEAISLFRESYPGIPVAVLASSLSKESTESLLSAGASHVVDKAVDLGDFVRNLSVISNLMR